MEKHYMEKIWRVFNDDNNAHLTRQEKQLIVIGILIEFKEVAQSWEAGRLKKAYNDAIAETLKHIK